MDFTQLLSDISKGLTGFTLGNAIMILAGLILIGLAVIKEYEPVLLLPIGFGCILANIGMSNEVGMMKVIYDAGITTELFPLLIFIGGSCRAIWHLWHFDPCNLVGVSTEPGRFDWCDRCH
jgi:Na+-transporting methylmalonyl-CoA/oxaloacetate decarboxylase beta subunit